MSREFHRSLKELREIQAERREQERRQMIQAAQLYKLHNEQHQPAQETVQSAATGATKKGAAAGATNEPTTPYDATQDGFVLANDEIETYIRREDRKTAARQADLSRPASAEAVA